MGRDSTNDIVVEQPVVSRKHARIYYNQDAGSTGDGAHRRGTPTYLRAPPIEHHSAKNRSQCEHQGGYDPNLHCYVHLIPFRGPPTM
jgi:hypothetical protein